MPGEDKPGLVRNLNSDMKRTEKSFKENAFDEKKKRPGLKFNPGLALTGLRTTRPWSFSYATDVSKNK